jgi:hypothetical protein
MVTPIMNLPCLQGLIVFFINTYIPLLLDYPDFYGSYPWSFCTETGCEQGDQICFAQYVAQAIFCGS